MMLARAKPEPTEPEAIQGDAITHELIRAQVRGFRFQCRLPQAGSFTDDREGDEFVEKHSSGAKAPLFFCDLRHD
jgi:hypothetical protein